MSRLTDIVARAHSLLSTALPTTDVVHGRSRFNEAELPAIMVFSGPAEVVDVRGDRYRMDGAVIVESYVEYTAAPGDEMAATLDAVRAALEVDDDTLRDLLAGTNRLALTGYEEFYPESSGGVAGVRIEYSAPHVSHFGGPE